ncbi:MAG: hypothetical protein IJF15_02340 [Oscillospiraceae bacterium]|nr:hypothetical protein [Oscillospiraceae bacterium]
MSSKQKNLQTVPLRATSVLYTEYSFQKREGLMKYRIQRFFIGRNGLDACAGAVLTSSFILMLIGTFIPLVWLRYTFLSLAWIGFFYAYFRILSRNLYKRQRENARFVELLRIKKLQWKERKQYKYFRCPSCKAWQRVPRGKGRIVVHCRVCRSRFDKKT